MSKEETKFAFTASVRDEPPPDAFHTYDEWMDLIKAGAIARGDHADLVVAKLDTGAIWARRNGKAG